MAISADAYDDKIFIILSVCPKYIYRRHRLGFDSDKKTQVKLLVSIIGINVLVILGIQGVSYVITEKNSAQRTLTMQRKNMEMASSVLCSASKFMSLPVALLKFRCKYSILTKKVRKATTNKHTLRSLEEEI